MFRASVIPISNDLVKIANSIFYNFIWNGKDKVKRCALFSDINKGGLKILHIESMVSAGRVICLKEFLEDYPSTWKSILNSIILPVLFAMRNQNPSNIYSPVVKCLLNCRKKSCPG